MVADVSEDTVTEAAGSASVSHAQVFSLEVEVEAVELFWEPLLDLVRKATDLCSCSRSLDQGS